MNISNYWKKDQTRQEIITKTQLPNKFNFGIYANYYNLMDAKGIGLLISSNINLEAEKLYKKNSFEYLILEHNNKKELYILPNDHIEEYANKIALKVDVCKNEDEVLKLLIDEMN